MSGKITRTTTLNKFVAEEKLRAEIKQLETAVNEMNPLQQCKSPELAELANKLGTLHKNKPLFRNSYGSDRISRQDATLRGAWIQDPLSAPVDADWSDEERDTSSVESDGCRGGWKYGVLSEAPERPEPRFHTPIWVRNRNQMYTFGQRLLRNYKKENPTLANFVKSKAVAQTQILFDYFIEHLEYAELYEKYRQPKNDIYDVSTKDAKTVQEAVEYSAEKNGTFSAFEEGGNVPWDLGGGVTKLVTPSWFDYVEHKFKLVTARKVNAEIFRVELHNDVEDAYYLPEKLDPSKKESTIAMQRYIADLVDEGYRLLKIAKPTDADRKAARQAREASEQQVIARAQLGSGTNPAQYEHTATLSDQSYRPSQARALHSEYGRLLAWENKLRDEAEAKATEGLNSYHLWLRERERGEQAFQNLMADTKAAEAVAMATRPWQPPVAEPEPTVTPIPDPAQTPAVRHEVLRMSIQVLLAAMVQGRTTQFQGARL